MPLYEYECEDCEHRFEVIQKFSDPPLETCPKCGGSVRKLLSSPAIQFKGSGWYITDYAKKDAAGSAAKQESGASGDGGAAAEKSDKAEKSGKSGTSDTSATTGSSESGAKATASPKTSGDST